MKTVWKMLAGPALGFLGAYALLAAEFESTFLHISFETTILIGGISLILTIWSFAGVSQMKKKASLSLSGEEEDTLDEWQYKKYSDVTLANNSSTFLSIIAISIAVITQQHIWLIVITGILFVTATICTYVAGSVLTLVYPERHLPKVSDVNYSKKLLETSDEGERHVMLEGLYFTFQSMNILLIGAMFILTLYSIGSNHSQLFSIIIIGLILTILNAKYILRIRNR
ncbi:DUF3169 family protein [Bacillus sp. NPDC077027]|uniref:DUF3169 family protein n=1 Tax=Bacillus sp. NPDC077027 TaxID=3390548 RepID=UPI003D07943A